MEENKDFPLKLFIGGGKVNHGKEWIHIDSVKYPHIRFNDPADLPFDSETIDYIYSPFVLNYYSEDVCLQILKEWKRVLKRGKNIRISVPDFFLISQKYIQSKMKIEDVSKLLVRRKMVGDKYSYSKQTLDFLSLQKLLLMAGFYSIKRIDIDKYPPSDDISNYYFNGENISLTIEAYG